MLLVMLYCLLSETIEEAVMFPLAPLAELAIVLGLVSFIYNLVQNGR